jgi:Zn-finger nucleic acid-binding protein
MQRRAFERSGVVLDTCILHGHWFDAGELGRVLAYASEHRVLPEAPRPQATLQLLKLLPWL